MESIGIAGLSMEELSVSSYNLWVTDQGTGCKCGERPKSEIWLELQQSTGPVMRKRKSCDIEKRVKLSIFVL